MQMTPELLALIAATADRAVEQAMARMGVRRKKTGRPAALLTASEAAKAQIAAQKPHLKRPTWVYLGKDVTCVWPLLDVIFGPMRQEMKKKTVAHMHEWGIGWKTVGNKAHSDEGPIPIEPKRGEDSSLYAPVDEILEVILSVAPRAGPRLLDELSRAKSSS